MSKDIPTPYVWSYQPQIGTAAGASQDYSTRMNWLSAGNSMINTVNRIRNRRNEILLRQALVTETPRNVANPPSWPAEALHQPYNFPTEFQLPRNGPLEHMMSNNGMQLAGGGRYNLSGCGYQLPESYAPLSMRSDGIFQLGGGSKAPIKPQHQWILLQSSSSRPRSGGLGSAQFVEEFVPSVYLNPYSGSPSKYPEQFIFNYDVVEDRVANYD
ncbi:pVIII [Mastadenovirus eidoli]|uniref:Pre-hexon-linking protein VIII n=1 Tax=Eidolon helvum adenovirus TaxID=2039267 RepID=A0A348FKH4_9ADEN|nr:pVIII [Eidolon helvum adenovirus]BBF72841.1 pVIII [Eidolon helvum adenovirus]